MNKSCENCKYEDRAETDQPCCSCIHNAVERFEPKESLWISVKHKLPKLRENVLVTMRDGIVCIGEFMGGTGEWFVGRAFVSRREVIAWMPLPEPYKGESYEMQ